MLRKMQKNGNPVSYDEAKILDEWAEEYNVAQHHPAEVGSGRHFHGGNYMGHTYIYNVHVSYEYRLNILIGGNNPVINGVILQRVENRGYKGVEGDNWYLNDILPSIFEDFYCENIEKSWYDSDYVDVCNDYSFIKKYMELSINENIKFRMLLCETDRAKPQLVKNDWSTQFIGYDYAYSGGSYYSAVYNDVYSKRIPQFLKFELNCNGLFENIDKLTEFIRLREHMIKQGGNKVLEQGDFIIHKLYEVIL